MKKTKEAFLWITNLLKINKIRYQITGGFVAKIYGSSRGFDDIDILLSNNNLFQIKNLCTNTIYGPKRYKDKHFDVLLLTLNYENQEIDLIGADDRKIFDKSKNKWINKRKIDFNKSNIKEIFSKKVPIIPLNDLISIKKSLGRKKDLYDVLKILSQKPL